jgi:S-adenosylmethionine decarboxylase
VAAATSSALRALHVLADLWEVDPVLLRDAARLEALLRGAAGAAGARVIAGHFHHFGGEGGVTGMLMLAESHLSIHTWPERGLAAVDAFMCGEARAEVAVEWLRAGLGAGRCAPRVIARGG